METSIPKISSLTAVILILAVLASGYFLINKFWPNYKLAQSQLQQAQDQNSKLKADLASVQTFLNEYQKQKDNASILNLALPSKNLDMANFVSSLSDLAFQSGVVLSNFQLESNNGVEQPRATANSLQIQNLTISVSGNYLAFKDFMLRLEDHLRLVDVFHVTMAAEGSTGTISALQYQLKFRTYFQQ